MTGSNSNANITLIRKNCHATHDFNGIGGQNWINVFNFECNACGWLFMYSMLKKVKKCMHNFEL